MFSMTGYGRATRVIDGRSLTVEIKSVNHRFLDLSMRLPRSFTFLEDTARKLISGKVARGHLEVFFTYQNLREDSKVIRVDTALAKEYYDALDKLKEALPLNDDRSLVRLSSYPEVMTVAEADEDEEALRRLLEETLDSALDSLNAMRLKEGEHMKANLLEIMDEIERLSYEVDARYPVTVEEFRTKLTARINDLLGSAADEARIAQEVAIMADKAAVDEETVRLRSHIKQAREKCTQSEPAGRSLDFLVQEMNREVNTISSKSQDIPITQAVLSCKSAIEKLREQLQNVE